VSRIRLDKGELPWAPLVPGGEGLNRAPADPLAIRKRLAAIFGVQPECITIALSVNAAINGIWLEFDHSPVIYSPDQLLTSEFSERIRDRPALLVERGIEFVDDPDASYVLRAAREPHFFLIRTLDAFGISSEQMVAIIHASQHRRAIDIGIAGLRPSTPLQHIAEAALHPSRMPIIRARIELIKAERKRLANALGLEIPRANSFFIPLADPGAFARYGVDGIWHQDSGGRATGSVDVTVGTPEENDRLLAAMGVAVPATPRRTATIARDTKETRIVASVDLDRAGTREVHTGIGFFDHMLDQVAAHGGFGLTLAVEGDLHIDPHHSIEDATLAMGAALKQALGDRAGIGRYGFVLPMDEAEARISIDLGGRPFGVFEGTFHASHIGEYPTALTAHVFRSLAESMGAAIHIHVTGEDDHHKTEACFKALGRALRQAIRVEGAEVPSTKGVL